MKITPIDWIVILGYFAISLSIGLAFARRAGKSISDYFISGRSLPWWLVGTSMVATTFAADTPLAVTGMVARHGIAGNWLWWNFVFSGMLTVFFYAKLWRRAGVLTDVEFVELRYSGKPASFLRAFRAGYLAIPINCIIMGWVTLGMAKVMELTLGVNKWEAIVLCLSVTVFYSIISGFWGIVVTDTLQFAIAMVGSIALAFFVLNGIGGIDGLKAQLEASTGNSEQILAIFPDLDSAWMPFITFFVYIGMNWWASWYPGAEPGGGGYIAQRMFSAKDERHSLLATLWFNIAHYALRPWPWIIVALCSIVLYPKLQDPETGYVHVMVDYLPPFWRGLLLAAFAAAYMSTISTHLNWGASYIVNDLYRRFIRKDGNEKHYVTVSRFATLLILVLSAIVTYHMTSIEGAWKFLLALGAGTGPVYILRWYWWRINAWSEISAMIGAFIVSLSLRFGFGIDSNDPVGFAHTMLITVTITTIIWLAVTFLTPPESKPKLKEFYTRVQPAGPGWKSIREEFKPDLRQADRLSPLFFKWILGCAFVYLVLFGIGKVILR